MRKKLIIALLLGSTLTFAVTRYIDQIQSQLAAFVTVLEDELRIGDGGDDDIKISANNGDGSIPYIFYDASSDAFGAANDGSTEDIFALLDASQVLTNKTFDDAITFQELSSTPSTPSSGYKKLYPKDDGTLYTLNDAGEEVPVGTGSGSGGINFITNSDFEINGDDWAKYEDAAGVAPVDGDGGTAANLTIVRNTTTPLRGNGDFKITKAAANAQGLGVSTPFTIDNFESSGAAKQYVKFDYDTDDDDYDDGDIRIYVFDVTNSDLIELDVRDLAAGTDTYFGTWQAASDSTSYRLILHIATTDANEWDSIFIDNVKAGPVSDISQGVSSPRVWNTALDATSSGDFTGGEVLLSRVGNIVTLSVGSNVSYSSTTLASSASGFLPEWARPKAVTFNVHQHDNNVYTRVNTDGTLLFVSSSNRTASGSFSMSYVMEDDLDPTSSADVAAVDAARPVILRARHTTSGATSTSYTTQVHDTVDKDTHGAYNSTTGVFTAPKSANYFFAASVTTSNHTAGERLFVRLYKNGSTTLANPFNQNDGSSSDEIYVPVFDIVPLEKGDTVELQVVTDSVEDYNSGNRNILTVQEWGANSALIDAQANVNIEGEGNGGASITANTTNITFTEVKDNFGAWDGSTFTAPRSDVYHIEGMVRASANISGWAIDSYINGAKDKSIGYSLGPSPIVKFSAKISLDKGDALTFRSSDAFTELDDDDTHWITISTR